MAESDIDDEWEYLQSRDKGNRTKKRKEGAFNADNKQKSDKPGNTKRNRGHTTGKQVNRENTKNRRNNAERPARAEADDPREGPRTTHVCHQPLFPNQVHRKAWIHDPTCRPMLDQTARRLLCRLANINTYKNKEKLASLVVQIKSRKTLPVLLTEEEMETCNRDTDPELMLAALQCYKVDKATEIQQFHSVLFHLNFAMQTTQ